MCMCIENSRRAGCRPWGKARHGQGQLLAAMDAGLPTWNLRSLGCCRWTLMEATGGPGPAKLRTHYRVLGSTTTQQLVGILALLQLPDLSACADSHQLSQYRSCHQLGGRTRTSTGCSSPARMGATCDTREITPLLRCGIVWRQILPPYDQAGAQKRRHAQMRAKVPACSQ